MIRRLIGWLIALWFILSGKLARMLKVYDRPENVLSLVGHDPKPEDFERLLSWIIKHGFTFVSTDDLLDGTLPDGRKAWLTFDDGWLGFLNLLPILEKYNVPVTIFIAPHETERGQLWPDSIMSEVTQKHIREMYSADLISREKEVDAILAQIGNPRRLMDFETLKKLAKHPLVTLENHTWSHLSCSHRPVAEIIDEVETTTEFIRNLTGRLCRLMCFPYGHYTREAFEAIEQLGLFPVTCDAGEMQIACVGAHRNMFREGVSDTENICRSLNAWINVTTPDRGC